MRPIDAEHLIDCINVVQEMALAIGGKLEAIEPVNEGFISLINSQPTIDVAPKWIPVTEELPETSRCKYILVTLYCPALNFKSVEPAYYINEKFYRLETARSFDDEVDEVIAWMPLPKPYEVKK